jgi:putative endonuclease
MKRGGSVYILTNVHNQVLYTGVTSELVKRISEHKEKKHDKSFSAAYQVEKLVYYENYLTIEEAILEEKRIKGGNRAQKITMIVSKNPEWRDLWEDISKW